MLLSLPIFDMKAGLKVYPKNLGYIAKCRPHVDFMEVMGLPGFDYSILSRYDLPYVVHCGHDNFGVNIADRTKEEHNHRYLDAALSLADKLGSRIVILHPGMIHNSDCSIENAKRFLKTYRDSRITLETMPYLYSPEEPSAIGLGSDPKGMRKLLKIGDFGLCLDFAHASAAAFGRRLEYLSFVEEFVDLGPRIIHLCDGKLGYPFDMHLHLGDGDLDVAAFLKMLPKESLITIETDLEIERQAQDLQFVRRLF